MLGQTKISFETKLLEKCIELTRNIDKLCFPQEMWLDDEELYSLTSYKAETTVLNINGHPIGQGITLPEMLISRFIEESDPEFEPHPCGVYSYSEAIVPNYQKLGYGALLLHEIALRMRQRGYTSISAHVRTRFGWDIRRRQTLQVSDTRMLHDFWDDPQEVVQYQQAKL